MSKPIRVLLADDHESIRIGIRRLLEMEPDIEIVAEAADGAEAVQLAADLKLDVVVMDVNMAGMDGVEATKLITATGAWPKVVALSASDRETAHEMLEAGASDYVAKHGAFEHLAGAIRKAMASAKGDGRVN